jgi:hypothetical protein
VRRIDDRVRVIGVHRGGRARVARGLRVRDARAVRDVEPQQLGRARRAPR